MIENKKSCIKFKKIVCVEKMRFFSYYVILIKKMYDFIFFLAGFCNRANLSCVKWTNVKPLKRIL